MIYKVMKKYGHGSETLAASYKTLAEAKAFVQQSAAEDALMKIQAIYRIYEFDEPVFELDPSKQSIETPGKQPEQSQGGSGKQSNSSFRPSPLTTSAKPKGAIQHWRDEEDDKDKK